MKKTIISSISFLIILAVILTGCRFTTEYRFKGIKYSVNNDLIYESTGDADIFKTENAEITIKQSESELRKLVHDSDYIEKYDVVYETDSVYTNEIYFAKTYMERSESKGGTIRLISIEYSFNISGKNYIIIVSDVLDVFDIKPIEEELENIVNSIDVAW